MFPGTIAYIFKVEVNFHREIPAMLLVVKNQKTTETDHSVNLALDKNATIRNVFTFVIIRVYQGLLTVSPRAHWYPRKGFWGDRGNSSIL